MQMEYFERPALLVTGDFDVLQGLEQGERLKRHAVSFLSTHRERMTLPVKGILVMFRIQGGEEPTRAIHV